ncbi:MAG TPA: diguanylate cyclase [Candidatus Dojkabacteria bacterium]|nr:diguanylate cyclase [Candidatus Dojkabacteria bacterium]
MQEGVQTPYHTREAFNPEGREMLKNSLLRVFSKMPVGVLNYEGLIGAGTLALKDILDRLHPQDRTRLLRQDSFFGSEQQPEIFSSRQRIPGKTYDDPDDWDQGFYLPISFGSGEDGGLVIELIDQTEAITRTMIDPLTGLWNQSTLENDLEALGQEGRQVGVLFLDLDNFKPINDKISHSEGNVALHQTGEDLIEFRSNFIEAAYKRLQTQTGELNADPVDKGVLRRKYELFKRMKIYRAGGDEFCIVIPGAEEEECRNIKYDLLSFMHEKNSKATLKGVPDVMDRIEGPPGSEERYDMRFSIGYASSTDEIVRQIYGDKLHPRNVKEFADQLMYCIKYVRKIPKVQPYPQSEDGTLTDTEIARLDSSEVLDNIIEDLRARKILSPQEEQTIDLLVDNYIGTYFLAHMDSIQALAKRWPDSQVRLTMGYESFKRRVKYALKLRNIGMIRSEGLQKNEEEWDAKEKNQAALHPYYGYFILRFLYEQMGRRDSELYSLSQSLLYSHARWDGQAPEGIPYPNPDKLSGSQIPLEAGFMQLVDAYMGMTMPRWNKAALTQEQAMEELQKMSGKQFEPEYVQAFLDSLKIKTIDAS